MCLAIPGQLLSVEGEETQRRGRVRFGGAVREVNLAFVPQAEVGDYVLVHVGVALSVIDEAEAKEVFSYLDQIGEIEEEIGGGPPPS
ncbi:MAG: HypC/HybG/HupF family hydrogenase formation chaperone [Fimbriimonadaceae bacterium]